MKPNIIQCLKHPIRTLRDKKDKKKWLARRAREAFQELRDFGILFARTPHILGIEKIKERMMYDSEWKISFQDGVSLKEITIIRHDNEKRLPLLRLLADATTVEAVKALDVSGAIYYD